METFSAYLGLTRPQDNGSKMTREVIIVEMRKA